MIALLVVVGLFSFIIAISASAKAGHLQREINRLESALAVLHRRVSTLEKAPAPQPAPAPAPDEAAPPPPLLFPIELPAPVEPPTPIAEPAPVPEPETPRAPIFIALPEPEPAIEPERAPELEPAPENEPAPQPEPVPEPELAAEPEPEFEPAPEIEEAIAAKAMPAATPIPPSIKAQPKKPDFEQRLGGGVFIWIGAIMLALAGAFLVKYSIDVGVLTPAVRVVLGLIMGGVLLGGGQWLRKDSPTIAQALAAAAVADWFASLFAATALYDLIPPTVGFVGLAIVTAIGIALALREGPFVGLVGIAGGFITPAIVSTGTPRPGVLFTYLFLIQLGTLILQRKRGWWYLTALGIGGGLLWALGWALFYWPVPDQLGTSLRLGQIWLPLFLLATDLTQLWSLHGKGGVAVSREMTLTARCASIGCFAIMAYWLVTGAYRLDDWAFMIMLAVAHLAAARRFTKEEIPALAGAAIVILAYASWSPVSMAWTADGSGLALLVDRSNALILVGLVLGAFFGVGGFAFIYKAANPTRWAGLSTLGSAFLLGGAYLNLKDQELWLSWTALAVILALLHAGAAVWLDKERRREKRYTGALGLHILAASGFLALAVPMQVEHEWIAVSWAFELPVMALVAWKLELPWVRRGIWAGGLLVGGAVLLSGFPTGEWLIFNRLLYGIGVPCVSMVVTAQLLKRMPADREGRLLILMLELAGAGLLALLIGLEIDHFIGRVAPDSGRNLIRAGSASTAWAAMALGLFRLYHRTTPPDRAILYAAHGFMVISVVALVGGCFLAFNPLLGGIDVGQTWFFNRLLVAYAAPAVLLMLVADRMRREPPPAGPIAGQTLALLAFVTAFLWVALTVRQINHGSLLAVGPTPGAEHYGYAGGWTFLLPLMAWIAAKRDFPWLRQAIWAGIVLIICAIGLSGLSTGEWLLFNPPLFGVGVPMIGMIATAVLVERTTGEKEGRALVQTLSLLATALLALLVWLEMTQVVGRFTADSGSGFLRNGLVSIAWGALALGFFRIERRIARKDRALLYAAYGFTALTAAAIVLGGFMVANPLLSAIDVGSPWIFNRLLLVYAVPAVLLMVIAERMRREPPPAGPAAAQALVMLAFATAFLWVALTVRQILHGNLLTVGLTTGAELYGYAGGWTFLLPMMAWIAAKRNFPWLREAIWFGIVMIVGAIGLSGLPTGEWLIFNPPLFGVGVPMLGMIATAVLIERTAGEKEGRALVQTLSLLATALLALLVWLETTQVVQWFTRDSGSGFLRNGLVSIAWAGLALGFFRIERRIARKDRALLYAAYGFAALTAAAIVGGGFILANPLLAPIDVGSVWVFNRLLLVYAIPAALMLVLADRLRLQVPNPGPYPVQAAGLLALVTGFFWVTLTIRQIAHGAILSDGPVIDAEQYGYSAAWTLYGLMLLGLGTWKRSQILRYASAAVVLITVSKVFLIDAANLTGLYRVGSFLGLGLSLIGIGYLYQRLLFTKRD